MSDEYSLDMLSLDSSQYPLIPDRLSPYPSNTRTADLLGNLFVDTTLKAWEIWWPTNVMSALGINMESALIHFGGTESDITNLETSARVIFFICSMYFNLEIQLIH